MLADLIATGVIGPGDLFSQFKDIFPKFANITQAQYDYWTAQAAKVTFPRKSCLGDEAVHATWLLTAHYLVQQGIGNTATDAIAASGATSFKSATFSATISDSVVSQRAKGGYASTPYGLQYREIIGRLCGGPYLVGCA